MTERTEQVRLRSNYDRVEALLRDFRWHSSVELMAVGGMRAVGRVHEVKAHGFDYEKRKKSHGVWEYRLLIRQEVQLPLVDEVRL